MQNIDDCVKTIRAARYGREVREPIAYAIEALEKAIRAGSSEVDAEVNTARNGCTTLRERLNKFELDFDTADISKRFETARNLLNRKLQEVEE